MTVYALRRSSLIASVIRDVLNNTHNAIGEEVRMSLHQTFRMNTPAVVSEAFEDEIVIIHLESGAYYSLEQSGAAIWQWLQQGMSLAEISSRLSSVYRLGAEEVARIVPLFIDELTQERLIVPANTGEQADNNLSSASLRHDSRTGNASFTCPTLTKFTDMQDLLLLDPIHNVDSSGWPVKK